MNDYANVAKALATGADPAMIAELCPVFTLRLRSSAGRTVADLLKAHMQSWDDSEVGR